MSKTPYISAIIPTYNRGKYIAAAVQSILDQKKNKWPMEVIVIDDGSTDDTEEVLKQFKDKITYIKTPNSGRPATPRNIGIKRAKGELIAFLDSDDMWVPDKLAMQIPLFDDSKIMMSCGNATPMDEDGKLAKKALLSTAQLENVEKFETLVEENNVSTLTTVVRKSALDAVGLFNESEDLKAVEDYELWLKISARFPDGVKIVPETLAYYRQHSGNISHADALLAVTRLLNVYNYVWDFAGIATKDRAALEAKLDAMHENWSRLMVEKGHKPAISVVLSIYQAEDHLQPAIEGILGQTFSDFEFIIIDDGCSDTSVEIVRSLKDPRIRLIRQSNHGLVYSLNKGIRIARADFIARQDADDISMPERIKKEFDWMQQDPKRALVGTFFTYIDEITSKPSITITSPTQSVDLRRMLRIVNPFAHGSVLFRKEAILAAGGYTDNYGPTEDYQLWGRIALHWEIGQIPESLYLYRINPKSISHTKQDVQHKFARQISSELWRAPLPRLSVVQVVKNALFYKHIKHYGHDVYNQYVHQQVLISFESLVRGKLIEGYEAAVAAIVLKPLAGIRLWKTLIWAPFKLLMGRQIK